MCSPKTLHVTTSNFSMSQADIQDSEKVKAEGGIIYGDSSGPLFAIYSKSAEKRDEMVADRWLKDAESIIIFNGLFSAIVAALVIVSLQDLRPNSQDTSAFYLEKLYELQAEPNTSRPSGPSTVAKPPAFSPSQSAIWVNTLWILSLVISLTCAMLATSLQQWARRYMQITQPATHSLRDGARLRAFFMHGITKFHIPRTVEVLPALVHLSLFTFFAGLLVYLSNINHTMFNVVICWVGLLSAFYVCITFMPIFWPDSPYYSPLSPIAWFLYTRILYYSLKVLHHPLSIFGSSQARCRIRRWSALFTRRKLLGFGSEIKEAILKQSADIDYRILRWVVRFPREDDEQEKVFESIPGFFRSDEVMLGRDRARRMTEDAIGYFLRRTLSSHSIPETVKLRRLTTCLDAANEVLPPILNPVRNMFNGLIDVAWGEEPDSIDIGHSLRSWDKGSDGKFSPYIRGIISVIVASARERGGAWAILARDHLGVSDSVFQDYLAHGDSVLFANLIHFTRHANRSEFFALGVVRSLSKFDARNTLPELQRDFCAMWNEVVREAQNGDLYSYPVLFLREIRHYYVALHNGAHATSEPPYFSVSEDLAGPLVNLSSYPLCKVPAHRSHSTYNGHEKYLEDTHPPATTSVIPSLLPPSSPAHTITHSPDESSLAELPPSTVVSSQAVPQVTVPPSQFNSAIPTAPTRHRC